MTAPHPDPPPFPGGIGVSHLRVYDTPAPDGLAGGTPHLHTVCTEAYAVVAGSGAVHTLTASGFEMTPLEPGAFVWFTPGTIHRLVNDGGLEILVLMANAGLPEAGDLVIAFPPDIVDDPDAYAAAAQLPDDDRTTAGPGLAPRRRRDLAVPAFLDLVARDASRATRSRCARSTKPPPHSSARDSLRSKHCGSDGPLPPSSGPASSSRRWPAATPSTWPTHRSTPCRYQAPSGTSAAAARSARMSSLADAGDRLGRRVVGRVTWPAVESRPARSRTTGSPLDRRTWSRSPRGTRSGCCCAATRHEPSACLRALCALQYDRPGVAWHGTFARFAEWPQPPDEGAVEWVDYDPNWRQFLGTTFTLMLRQFELSPPISSKLQAAIALAIEGEPRDRVSARYSNIALMKAWLEEDEPFASEVVQCFDEHGAFDEYGSPTYYGIDLYALALWMRYPPAPRVRDVG